MTNVLKSFRTGLFATVGLFLSSSVAFAQTSPQSLVHARITTAIDNSSRVSLAGSHSPRATAASDIGALSPSTQLQGMTLVFSQTPDQQTALQALIAGQQDPASPLFHQWLTPEQFATRFGVAASDISAAESWLQQQGFNVQGVSRSRTRISFSGSAAQVKSAFGAELHNFRSTDGSIHFAPASDLSVPAALGSAIQTVSNLSSFRPRSHIVKTTALQPKFTSSQTGNIFLTPLDVATIYDINPAYNAGDIGAGQTIAIIGQSAILPSDIANFQIAVGHPQVAPTLTLMPGTGASEVFSGDESESDLDLEYSSTIARGATINFVYTGSSTNFGVFDALGYAIDNRIGNIISISYGECEPLLGSAEESTQDGVLAQAATQGQTVISAAGDQGSTDCYTDGANDNGNSIATQETPAVDYPAASDYVTGMGGTEFPLADVTEGNTTYFQGQGSTDIVGSAKSYIPEQVWNDDSATIGAEDGASFAISSGGGGVSIYSPRPSWQNVTVGGVAIPASSFRFVPDISLAGSPNNPGYAYCTSDTSAWSSTTQVSSCTSGLRDASSQGLTLAGGTSFDAPIFAGILAIINQAKGYTTGQGLVNPTLYTLASNTTTYASAFHDIISGSNACTAGTSYCNSAYTSDYAATTGYDEASGLGSLDVYNLLTAWPKNTSAPTTIGTFALSAAALTVTPGTTATNNITVTPSGGYTGTVNLTVVSASPGLTFACFSFANSVAVTGTAAVSSALTLYTNEATCPSGSAPLVVTGTAKASIESPAQPGRNPLRAPLSGSLAALLLAGCFGRRSRLLRSKLQRSGIAMVFLMLIGLGVMGMTGCGGGGTATLPNSPTNPIVTNMTLAGTYTITVAGTDSLNPAASSTTTFTVTVN
jgi:subtilase family serine protease